LRAARWSSLTATSRRPEEVTDLGQPVSPTPAGGEHGADGSALGKVGVRRTPLTGTKLRAARQAAVRARKASASGQRALTRSRHLRCERCLGHSPSQSLDVRRRRGRAIAAARADLALWRTEHPDEPNPSSKDFARIGAGLAEVKGSEKWPPPGCRNRWPHRSAPARSFPMFGTGRCSPTWRASDGGSPTSSPPPFLVWLTGCAL
jgi:hypothetical protein